MPENRHLREKKCVLALINWWIAVWDEHLINGRAKEPRNQNCHSKTSRPERDVLDLCSETHGTVRGRWQQRIHITKRAACSKHAKPRHKPQHRQKLTQSKEYEPSLTLQVERTRDEFSRSELRRGGNWSKLRTIVSVQHRLLLATRCWNSDFANNHRSCSWFSVPEVIIFLSYHHSEPCNRKLYTDWLLCMNCICNDVSDCLSARAAAVVLKPFLITSYSLISSKPT